MYTAFCVQNQKVKETCEVHAVQRSDSGRAVQRSDSVRSHEGSEFPNAVRVCARARGASAHWRTAPEMRASVQSDYQVLRWQLTTSPGTLYLPTIRRALYF